MLKSLATLWDRIPVRGAMAAVVTVLGMLLVLFLAPHGRTCNDAGGLRNVYKPSRLHVLAKCQTMSFQVYAWRLEHDGDLHVNGRVLGDPSWVNAGNIRGQHGFTTVEFVPHDPRPRQLAVGMVLRLLTTKVEDWGHGGHWVEGHPVFSVQVLSQGGTRQDPLGLAPKTEG